MGLFGKRKTTAIGLDIGHSAIKGLELQRVGNDLVVENFGCVPVPFTSSSIKRAEVTASAIKKLFADFNFTTKRIVTAVSGEAVIVRVLRLPYFSEKETQELQFAVQSEAADFIPYDMSDVAFDYQRLGVIETGGDNKGLEVLIVAAQKELVNWHTNVVKDAGLDPRVVDIGSFALVNAVHYGAGMAPPNPIALVDIGSAVTNIAIMKGDSTRFTRDLSTAGSSITRAIMSELGLDEKAAEKAKIDYGISYEGEAASDEPEMLVLLQSNLPEMLQLDENSAFLDNLQAEDSVEQRVHAICMQFLGEIVSEIKRCLLFYENQLDGEPVETVYLTGGTVRMNNAQRYIQTLLDTHTEILDPFVSIKGKIVDMDAVERGTLYTTSLGLAMRSVMGGGVS